MLGVITEYNPFHNGHKLHIELSKKISKCDECIVVMSGNFVQRGEPAIFDKYIRTKMALLNGANVVLELPTVFSTSSAELFCRGSIDILNKTGIVTNVCFGSENGDINSLKNIAKILADEPKEYKDILSNELKKGISYPKARERALQNITNNELTILKEPNNILAIEYLKSLILLKSYIIPLTIKRTNSFHSKYISSSVSSATAIREAILNNNICSIKKTMPENCFDLIKGNLLYNNIQLNDFSNTIRYILKTSDTDEIKNTEGMVEGLENRFFSNLDFSNIEDLIQKVKSKRYTYSKIQRLILHVLLNITKNDVDYAKNNLNEYIRVLGFRKNSTHILKELSEKSKIPVITNIKDAKKVLNKNTIDIFYRNMKYDEIYHINKNRGDVYRQSVVIV